MQASFQSADIRPRRRHLVGVSGGRDSVALLHWLIEAGCRDLVICHLNHGLRGRESGSDAAFVRRLAKSYGLSCEAEKTDVRRLAEQRGLSLEAAGRAARLEFFDRVGRAHRCRRVILGHHADDQVETVLINLFRGSATLSGMRPSSEITVNGRKLELLRPLLGVWRDEIDAYITEHSLRFREDGSNASDSFLRNRVRAELVPALKRLFRRDVTEAVVRAADIAAAESAFIDGIVADLDVAGRKPGELSVPKLRALELALQRRVLLDWLRTHGVADLGFEEVERVREMLNDKSIAKVNLPGGRHARRRAGVLFLEGP